MDRMTNTEYVGNSGLLCPYCKSTDVIASNHDADEMNVRIGVKCYDCFKSWQDRYVLTGYYHETEEE
jgi:Zn ribbon nucleic-acid-binding protein